MNRLTFIGSIQLNSPSTGGGVQTKNQHFLRYILSKNVDCRVFDTWKKKSVLSLIMSLIYIVRTKRSEPIILSISTRGAYYSKNTKFNSSKTENFLLGCRRRFGNRSQKRIS